MFAQLLGAMRADLDRQIEWARVEVGRQASHTALMLILAGAAAIVGSVLLSLASWPFILGSRWNMVSSSRSA